MTEIPNDIVSKTREIELALEKLKIQVSAFSSEIRVLRLLVLVLGAVEAFTLIIAFLLNQRLVA